MKEYRKNKNEYIEDGRLYIENIKSCICSRKVNGKYVLCCDIHQRGYHSYRYDKEKGFITKDGKKGLYLSQTAAETADEAVTEFDEIVERMKNGGFEKIVAEELNLTVYIEKLPSGACRFVEEYTDRNGDRIIEIENGSVFDEMHRLRCMSFGKNGGKTAEILCSPDEETIAVNPFYISALKSGNEMLALRIKLFYNAATDEDCRRMTELTGKRILPKLAEKYNRNYAVVKDSVSFELLGYSGYRILHRPYFAMMNHTHKNITLNPHTRTGVDAAPAGEEPITFDEFLKLFEEAENNE